MSPDVQAILDLAQQALDAKAFGVLGVLGVLLTGAVQLYKLPLVQALLSRIPKVGPYLAWDNLGDGGKLLVVFLLSAVGALLTAVAGGTGWGAALVGALVVGVSAIGVHQTGKAVLRPVGPKLPDTGLRPGYDPGKDPSK